MKGDSSLKAAYQWLFSLRQGARLRAHASVRIFIFPLPTLLAVAHADGRGVGAL